MGARSAHRLTQSRGHQQAKERALLLPNPYGDLKMAKKARKPKRTKIVRKYRPSMGGSSSRKKI